MMDDVALDIIILSVLRAQPVHGYELKRRVQRPTLSPLSNNSLYPYLRRFEQAGALTVTVEDQDGKPARKVYAITDVGRQLLLDLLSTLPPDLASNDEEFLVRLSFFNEITVPHRQAILSARAAVLDRGIAQVRTLVGESPRTTEREWRNLAMEHLLDRLESERRWIADLAGATETQSRTGIDHVG